MAVVCVFSCGGEREASTGADAGAASDAGGERPDGGAPAGDAGGTADDGGPGPDVEPAALRGYFCESDADCGAEETCIPLPGAVERICQPASFLSFLDATTFVLDTADLEPVFVEERDGTSKITVKGFANVSVPGDPDLPSITFNVVVPPDADTDNITIRLITEEYYDEDERPDVAPAGPANFRPEIAEGKTYEDWIKDREYIVNGRNTRVYGADALFMPDALRLLPARQMRKWLFVPVQFFPYRYNPVQKTLVRSSYIKVHLEVPLLDASGARTGAEALFDSELDDVAAGTLANLVLARPFYISRPGLALPPPAEKSDYVVVTTKAARNALKKLDAFTAHKKTIGYRVLVADEDAWGSQAGKDGPEKVRNWLKANYAAKGFQYVLLLADPTGTAGPAMRECWPRSVENGKKDDWERTPSDAYYSDLTGDWDKDGDGIWCEYGSSGGDTARGGLDLTPEVYVGRIPVYPGREAEADAVLSRTVAYETERDIAWRYTALMPNPISDYSHEEDHGDNGGNEIKRNGFTVDGAKFAERQKADYLNSRSNVKTVTLYEKRGPEPSKYASDVEFSEQKVADEWKKGYGIVTWWAHGNSTSAAGKVWKDDANKDGIAQLSEKDWEDFAYSSMPVAFNSSRPSFTSQVSCLNSRPDKPTNLSYTLLQKGGAVAAMGATSVTLYSPSWSYQNANRMDNVSFGYYYTQNVVKNMPAGKALALVRAAATAFSWGDGTLMNVLSFNLFGDPSLALFTTYAAAEQTADPALSDNGHAFDPNAKSNGADALAWSLYYLLGAPKGELKVRVEILDKNGAELKSGATAVGVERKHAVDGEIAFDGDGPDRYVLEKTAFRFLGTGTFDLKYRIRFTYTPAGGQAKDLLLTAAKGFSLANPAQDGDLQPGTPAGGTLSSSTTAKKYRLVVAQGGRLVLDLAGPAEADFDLYVNKGATVDTKTYLARGYTETAIEHVDLDVEAGEYSVLVDRYSGDGAYTLNASITTGGDGYPVLKPGEAATGNLPARYKTVTYRLDVTGSGTLTAILDGPAGSVVDLYLKRGKAPTTSSYDVKAAGATADPELTQQVSAGTYFVMLRTRKGSGQYTILATVE
jgi:hypothetical protein